MTLPKIKHVRAWFIGGATAEQGAGGGDYHDRGANHWIDDHIATPMSKYKQYEQSRQSFGINVLGTLIVEVEADNGQTGFAVSTAGEMGCFIVEKHLNRFIEGKCVSDIKLIHDQMLNATLYYAGSGGLGDEYHLLCRPRRCGTCSGKWLACRSTNCWVGRCATKSSSMPPAHVRTGAGDGLYRRQNAYPLGAARWRRRDPQRRRHGGGYARKMRPGFLVNAGLLDEPGR